MRLYRESNIKDLYSAVEQDQYVPVEQYKAGLDRANDKHRQYMLDFIQRNWIRDEAILEVGSGGGVLLPEFVADYYLEPSKATADILRKKLKESMQGSDVSLGVLECIPSIGDMDKVGTVVFTNGFFQVRSDMECLIEINRILIPKGRFIFNILVDDSWDIVCGRVLGFNNYLRFVGEFGFSPVEIRPDRGFICVEKSFNFDANRLRKLQLVERQKGLFELRNYHKQRDERLL